ncbi:MAG: hypothetical protein SNI51_05970 [Rikenellaceae bacterium]
MEHISRMAAEVNKLIGGKLLSSEAIHLPEVGSLYIIKDSSPKKKVEFSSNEHGSSLISVIEERASCTTEQATEIYNKWLEEVRSASIIAIEGVGELRGKSFVTSTTFLTQLNPQYNDNTTMEKKKKRKGGVIIFIIIILLLLLVVGYFISTKVKETQAEKARIETIARERAAEQQRVADSINLAQIEARRLQELEASEAASNSGLRYKVVFGVFELRSNIDNAHTTIAKIPNSHEAKEYPLGTRTLVSMFESDNRQECQNFLMTNYNDYPDSWVYDSQQ